MTWRVKCKAVGKIPLMTRLTKSRGKSFPTRDSHKSPNTLETPTRSSSMSTVSMTSAKRKKNTPRSTSSSLISKFQSPLKKKKMKSRKKKTNLRMKKLIKSRKSRLNRMTLLSLLMKILARTLKKRRIKEETSPLAKLGHPQLPKKRRKSIDLTLKN